MSRQLLALLRGHPATVDPGDAHLLDRFTRDGDEASFTELVRRHGPLVLGVCRRMLWNPADADDAFQATFLVLVRRAPYLSRDDALGPWLHRVAYWTARNVRRGNCRRAAVGGPLAHDPAAPDRPIDTAVAEVDALIARLPATFRTPIILCCLEGWSRRAAAEHLGCSERALSARLTRGLARLRRLASPGTLAGVWAGVTIVSGDLIALTVKTAVVLPGSLPVPGFPRPAVVSLSNEVLKMFWIRKVTGTTATLLVCVACAGAGLATLLGPRNVEAVPTVGSSATPVPKELAADEGRAGLARQQREAVAVIEKLGGRVMYDYQKLPNNRRLYNVFDPKAELAIPRDLRDRYGDDYFRVAVFVDFSETGVKDDDLKHLTRLPFLENLNLTRTGVTNAGLAHLKGSRHLRCLSLWQTRVGDAGLEHLEGLAGLWQLVLDETEVTDAGMVHLTGLTNLQEWLGLAGTKVTDAGVGHLAGLTRLRALNLRRTGVTPAGVAKLKESLKATDISSGP